MFRKLLDRFWPIDPLALGVADEMALRPENVSDWPASMSDDDHGVSLHVERGPLARVWVFHNELYTHLYDPRQGVNCRNLNWRERRVFEEALFNFQHDAIASQIDAITNGEA